MIQLKVAGSRATRGRYLPSIDRKSLFKRIDYRKKWQEHEMAELKLNCSSIPFDCKNDPNNFL